MTRPCRFPHGPPPSSTLHPQLRRRLNASARQAVNTATGILIIALALAAWAVTWVLGGRELAGGLLAGDVSSVSGLEIITGTLFLAGVAFILGVAWKTGTTGSLFGRKDRRHELHRHPRQRPDHGPQ